MASRITWRSGIPLLIAAALITACGSDSSDNSNGNGHDNSNGNINSNSNSNSNNNSNNSGWATCSMTLSGAQTGTATCKTGRSYLTRINRSSKGASSFLFFTSGTPKLSAFLKISGPVANGTYEFSRRTSGTVSLTNGKSKWYVEDGPGTNVKMTITSVTTFSETPTSAEYQAHGTLTAILKPFIGTPATGNVTVTLTF